MNIAYIRNRKVLIAIILICLAGGISYANSLSGAFIWDDEFLVAKNPLIRDARNIPRLFTTELRFADVGTLSNYYRPLQALSYIFDYHIWGLNSFGYHLTSTILHILNAILVFFLVRLLLQKSEKKLLPVVSHLFSVPLFAAILWVVHPAHTESVSYISGRADLLAGFFMLSALVLYLRARKLYFSVFCFILALLSREIALIFPVLIILCDVYLKKLNFKSIPLYLLFLAVALIYIVARSTVLNFVGSNITNIFSGLGFDIFRILKLFSNYLQILFFPVGLHLERQLMSFSFYTLASLVFIAYIFVVVIKKYNLGGLAVFSTLWFIINTVFQSNIFAKELILAEHFMYLGSIGFFILMSLLINYFWQRRYFLGRAIFIVLFLFYSTLTFAQNINWKDPITFYQWSLMHSPFSVIIHNNLGTVYFKKGLFGAAADEFKKAVLLNPRYLNPHINLARVYFRLGDVASSIRQYGFALESSTNPREVREYFFRIFRQEALFYKEQVKLDSKNARTYYNLALIYAGLGKFEKSRDNLAKVLTIDPDHKKARLSLDSIEGIAK